MLTIRDPFRRSQVAIGALFCFLGFQYGTWVSRVPALQERLGLDEAQIGLMLLAPGIGAAVSFALVSVLMRRFGSRLLALASAAVLVVVLGALAVSPAFWADLAILFVDGVAIACLNVAMNAQGAALESRHRRTTMAKLHAVFSGGTFVAALLASAITAVTEVLTVHFLIAAVALIALLPVAWSGTLRPEAADTTTPEPATRKRRWAVPSLLTVTFCVAMVLAEITEGAMNDWSALYLRDVAHAAPALTPLGVAVVSAVMLVARLFADGWRARWGDKRVVLAGSVLAACGLGGALTLGGVVPALLGFACVGLGMAATTPCIYVAAARLGDGALALVASLGTVGLLAGPPLIGFVARATDLVWGMSVVVLATLLLALCILPVRWPAASPEPVAAGVQ